jgi:hypothetical protein
MVRKTGGFSEICFLDGGVKNLRSEMAIDSSGVFGTVFIGARAAR